MPTPSNKIIIEKGEIGNITDFPVFEFLVNGELEKCVLFNSVQKILDKALLRHRQELKEEIEKLITIHKQLSKEIVGNNDFHIGAIEVLNRVLEKL